MPEIDNGSSMPSMQIQAGESIKNAAPSQEASPHTEETTPAAQSNTQSEVISQPADEAVTEGETDDFVSGGAKARRLGERGRKLAKSLLDSAATAEGRDNFKKLVQEDKEIDKYFKKHFSDQYQAATSEPANIDASTQAKILAENIRGDKEDTAYDLAVRLKFTEDEATDLTEMALKLEGTKVGGKELDYEEALKRAARIIRPDKAKVGITQLPASKGLDNTAEVKTQQKNEELISKSRGVTGYKPNESQMLQNLEVVNKGYDSKNRRFVMPEEYM